jgi:hypothetical protein
MRRLRSLLAVLCLLVLAAPAPAAEFNTLNVKGKVMEVGPQVIVVQAESGEKWFAGIDRKRTEDGVTYNGVPEPKIEVTGIETAAALRVGMYVRFEADVERKSTIKGNVSELTVIGRGGDDVYGLHPVGAAPGEEPKGRDTERMLVVGKLTAASRSGITVSFQNGKSIKAKLAPDAVVNVASNDIELARPGDEVELQGQYLKAPRVFATAVHVTRGSKNERGARKPATPSKPADAAVGKKPKAGEPPPAFGEGDPRDAKPADAPAKFIPGRILKVN